MKASIPGNSLLSRIASAPRFLAYPLQISNYLELINPLWASHRLMARVVKVWDETKNARTLTLRPGRHWKRHQAGQYVSIRIPVAGKFETRYYTISSPPERNDGCFTITVKAAGRGSHSLVRDIQVGDYLPIGLPDGDFVLPDPVPEKLLFITGGIGITPAMSMLSSLIARKCLPDSVHLHYSPNEFEVVFDKQLKEMAKSHSQYRPVRIFTQPADGIASLNEGRFSPAQLDRLCPDWKDREVFACGPETLLTALTAHFERTRMSPKLHLERFGFGPPNVPVDGVGGLVRLVRSGLDVEADAATNLLLVAEQAGLKPKHGCRQGICHTCNVKLVSGSVRDLRTGKLFDEVGGPVQICVSATAGNCELDL